MKRIKIIFIFFSIFIMLINVKTYAYDPDCDDCEAGNHGGCDNQWVYTVTSDKHTWTCGCGGSIRPYKNAVNHTYGYYSKDYEKCTAKGCTATRDHTLGNYKHASEKTVHYKECTRTICDEKYYFNWGLHVNGSIDNNGTCSVCELRYLVYVIYDANGGTGATDPQEKSISTNVSIELTSAQPTRTGYAFKGWATTSNATSVEYKGGDTFSGEQNLTLYAV